eukprot:2192582-Pyramimonas_sp.AAC.1
MLIHGGGSVLSSQRPRHLYTAAACQRMATPMAATPRTPQTTATNLDTDAPGPPACWHQNAARGSWTRRRLAGDAHRSRVEASASSAMEATRTTRRRIMALTFY